MTRPLAPEDAVFAAALHARCFDAPWPAADFARYASDPAFVTVAIDQPDLVALLIAQQAGDDVEILSIMVDAAHRRSGLGARLLQALLQTRPHHRVILDVAEDNWAARRLYDAAGFVEVARRKAYYAHGADALVMARTPR